MKRLIYLILSISLISNYAFATCDWANDIKNLPNGTYSYTADCHLLVGQTVQDDKVKTQQVQDLTQAVALKDQALQKSDQRVQLWMDTSTKLEDNVQKMETLKKDNEWIFFGLGIISVFAAGIAVSNLTNRH